MASRPHGASLYSLGLAVRAGTIAALVFGVVQLLATYHLYATALVVSGVAVLVFLDLRQAVARADRALGRFVDGLANEDFDRAGRGAAGFAVFAVAMDQAAARLQAVRAERQRRIDYLQTLADSVVASLVVVGRDGAIVLANRAARKLAGEDVSRLDQIPVLGTGPAKRLAALGPGGREIVRLQDGRHMLASTVQFRAPGGDAQRLISLQDVALELDAVELKAWQDLVRVLAHEMMNSLTPISSLAESIQSRLDEPVEVAAAVEVIARRSLGLMSFVDRYRKIAEIPTPVLGTVSLGPFVAAIDGLMKPVLEAANVTYRSQVEPNNLMVSADEELLEQAIINLLKNAIDAVATVTEPSISLSCRLRDAGVEISVADNGRGLTQDIKDKLFVPFFTTKPGGSGIGLSIARQIALAHHGQLEVHQIQPSGVVFTLVLPATVSNG
jgi:nitrogen fixation/metabolism regulation signal transduction histidine kinase